MKRFLMMAVTLFYFYSFPVAAEPAPAVPHIGVVNITQLFSNSAFVQNANKKLQTQIAEMEAKVQEQQTNLQDMMAQYEKANLTNKRELHDKIAAEQTKLSQMTQDFQQKIKDEQNVGMQNFSDQIRSAVEKIAKQKQLSAVLSNAAVVYSDPSWTDITPDVAAAMK